VCGCAAGAYDVTISPRHDQYSVGDVIACSARGFPAPEIRWSRDDDDDVTVTSHANLSVSADMLGDNSWTCSAQNELNHGQSATLSIQFTVVAGIASSLSVCLSVCLSVRLSVCHINQLNHR